MSIVSKYNRIAPIYELIDLPLSFCFPRNGEKMLFQTLVGRYWKSESVLEEI